MFSKRDGQFYFFAGLIIVISCWLIFWSFPELDRAISFLFFDDELHFIAANQDGYIFFRKFFIWVMTLFYVGVIIGGLKAYKDQKPVLKLEWDGYAFLGACGLIGPGLIVNAFFKSYWGRARPRDIVEFGDTQIYSQFWQFTDQCELNCSFASGEVATIAMIFISLSILVVKPSRYLVLFIGAILTALVAWLRVSVGAHFFTDSLVGTGLMLMVAPLVYCFFATSKKGWIRKMSEKQQRAIDTERLRSDLK